MIKKDVSAEKFEIVDKVLEVSGDIEKIPFGRKLNDISFFNQHNQSIESNLINLKNDDQSAD